MKENGMINAQEVLKLFDTYMGYGQDSYSQEVLKSLELNDKMRHVTTRKNMGRYIKEFSRRKFKEKHNVNAITNEDLDSIIKIEGTTKSAKYEKKGIIEMLKDEKIKRRLEEQFQKNTTLLEGRRVPKCVLEYYELDLSGIIEQYKVELFYNEVKDDSINTLKIKLSVIEQLIESRLELQSLLEENEESYEFKECDEVEESEEYDEVVQSRSPESIYYYEIEK